MYSTIIRPLVLSRAILPDAWTARATRRDIEKTIRLLAEADWAKGADAPAAFEQRLRDAVGDPVLLFWIVLGHEAAQGLTRAARQVAKHRKQLARLICTASIGNMHILD